MDNVEQWNGKSGAGSKGQPDDFAFGEASGGSVIPSASTASGTAIWPVTANNG
jgi:hypothetical protein